MTSKKNELDITSSDPPHDLPKPIHPRKILFGCLLFVLLGAAAYFVVISILPARLTDGPIIQNVSSHAATLIWYTSKPAAGQVALTIEGAQVLLPAANEGTRHRLRLTGLTPATSYPYEIRINQDPIAHGALTTSQPRGGPLSFIVFGDSGRGWPSQYELAAEMNKIDADFILHTGDVVYGAGERDHYPKRFFQPYRHMLARMPIWPSLGNHDVSKPSLGGDYLGVFELPENGPAGLQPERNYWFDNGDARIVIIDTNQTQTQLAEQVAPWLTSVLSDPQVRWRFVVMHHPPYSSGKHGSDQRLIDTLVPIFDALTVDIVFSGHDHTYQRTKPMRAGRTAPDGQGVTYVVTGVGGASIYPLKPRAEWPDYLAAGNDTVYGFTHVTIERDKLTLRQVALGGDELDRWELDKNADEE